MNNVMKIVEMGMCVGCGSCKCEHIAFQMNQLGFPSHIVDENCINCGQCLELCIYNPDNED